MGSTMGLLVMRSSFSIVNQSSVPVLLKRIQRAALAQQDSQTQTESQVAARQSLAGVNSLQNPAVSGALTILLVIAKNAPLLFRPHVGELKRIVFSLGIGGAGQEEGGEGMLREVALRGLASLVRLEDSSVSGGLGSDRKLTERILRVVVGSGKGKGKARVDVDEDMDADGNEDENENEDVDGADGTTEWRQAKFATRYLAHLKDGQEICAKIVEVGWALFISSFVDVFILTLFV